MNMSEHGTGHTPTYTRPFRRNASSEYPCFAIPCGTMSSSATALAPLPFRLFTEEGSTTCTSGEGLPASSSGEGLLTSSELGATVFEGFTFFAVFGVSSSSLEKSGSRLFVPPEFVGGFGEGLGGCEDFCSTFGWLPSH
jgi:hypothetical protein